MTAYTGQMLLIGREETSMAFGQIGKCIRQAWEEDYPPELAPANVKGRKMWRKVRLVDLIAEKFGMNPDEAASFREYCGDLGDTETSGT